jgi:Ca2+-binding EF-hand superfamily protein
MDRVELAFRKFDMNNDGYLSREEFDVVRIQKNLLHICIIHVGMK